MTRRVGMLAYWKSNTGAAPASSRKNRSATIDIFQKKNIMNNFGNQDMLTYLFVFLMLCIERFDVSISHSREIPEREKIYPVRTFKQNWIL